MKVFRGLLAVLFVAFVLDFIACSSPYATSGIVNSQAEFPGTIERARKDKLPMRMHSGVNLYMITSVDVDKAHKQFTVQLDLPDSIRPSAPDTLNAKGQRRVHFFMTDSTSYTLDEPHTIPLNKIERIEFRD